MHAWKRIVNGARSLAAVIRRRRAGRARLVAICTDVLAVSRSRPDTWTRHRPGHFSRNSRERFSAKKDR